MRAIHTIMLSLLLFTCACAPSMKAQALDRVAVAQREAHARPGARQAEAYADAIHSAVRAGAYEKGSAALATAVDDALLVLETAATHAGPDAATLIAWKALLLTDAGRYDQALAEFDRSMQIRPNLVAARNLALIWGTANQPDKVGEICAATVPVLTSVDDVYLLIGECMEHMNALSDDAALAWATPEIVTWYRQERERRQQAVAAELRAQVEREEREQRVVRETEMCAADCLQTGLACQNDCYGDAECEGRCVEINHACLDRCESAAYRSLGR